MIEPMASLSASPNNSAAKKAYHAPDLRDYGTVKELTLTGGRGDPDNIQTEDYATGGGTIG